MPGTKGVGVLAGIAKELGGDADAGEVTDGINGGCKLLAVGNAGPEGFDGCSGIVRLLQGCKVGGEL